MVCQDTKISLAFGPLLLFDARSLSLFVSLRVSGCATKATHFHFSQTRVPYQKQIQHTSSNATHASHFSYTPLTRTDGSDFTGRTVHCTAQQQKGFLQKMEARVFAFFGL